MLVVSTEAAGERLERLVEDEDGGLVVAVQELDVEDVVHGVRLDDGGQVQRVGGEGGGAPGRRPAWKIV
jgi:hypothetical protein